MQSRIRTAAVCATLAAAFAAPTPAEAQTELVRHDVRGSGAFVATVGASPNRVIVTFECTAYAYYDPASTSVDNCWLSSNGRAFTVTNAGNCSLRLPGALVVRPCTGEVAVSPLDLATDVRDGATNNGVSVCWAVSAEYILSDPRRSRTGCSQRTILPAGGGLDIETSEAR